MAADRRSLALIVITVLLAATPALAGGPLTSAVTANGALSGPSFTETWTYAGTNGDRVIWSAVTTTGAVNTVVTVRAPGGALISSSALDRGELQLASNGTYTIEISDQGLNDVGTYNLTLMNLTAGPWTHAGDLDGGPVASGEVLGATMGAISEMDAFTFSGTAGQRVVFAVLEGTAAPFNVGLILYPPTGGVQEVNTSSNRLDAQLAASGTYTVLVEDSGNDHIGSYTATFLNVSAGPHSTGSDPDGGTIASANLVNGTVHGVLDLDAFTFTGSAGDRIVVSSVTTSGAMNTFTYLYPPNGGAPQQSSAIDRWDFQLTQSGVHTLVIEDFSFGETGTYSVGLLNLSGPLTHAGDLDGGPIASGEVKNASIGAVPDFDAYTFPGTAGQRIVFGVLEGTAAPFNVALTLYPPNGGPAVANTGGSNRLDTQLAATGTYTMVVEDLGTDHIGSYDATFLNVSAGPHSTLSDPDGGSIASANLVTGTINGVIDLDAFTFSGSAGDRVLVTALTTSGAMTAFTYLYPPNGGAPQVAMAGRWDFQLTQSGTHTIVMEDFLFGETGTYTVGMLNLTSGPLTHAGDLDGGPISSGEVRSATIGTIADLDAYTFTGTAGQRIVFGVLEGTAPPFNVALRLFPPNGGPAEVSGGGSNRLDAQLAATGTYTVVVDDVENNDTGSYEATFLNVTAGPHTTLSDPDGGALPSASVATGAMNGVVDLDAFTFSGTAGDRIIVAAVKTGGTMDTFSYLYPPNGGPAQVAMANDRWEFQLTQSGTHALVIEDQLFGQTGTYATTLLNVTAGPLTQAADLDGGPLATDQVTIGTAGTVPDLDGYTFSGTLGDRVVIAAIATGGASFNTSLNLYPAAGGGAVGSTSGDRLDVQLPATGTYTVVIEDVGNDVPGSYSLSLAKPTAGPVVSGGDPDGGWLFPGVVRTGNVNPAPDLDVYWFNAQAGDNAVVSCVTTSGPLNTMTWLYPPGGGGAVVSTAVDNWNYGILVTGRHALMVQHSDLIQTGAYQLSLSGSLTPITVDTPPLALPTRVALSPARPNPSTAAAAFTVELPRRATIHLSIYDLRGARVRTLIERTVEAGAHSVAWDGRDDRGRRVDSGIYLAKLSTGSESVTRRVVRLD